MNVLSIYSSHDGCVTYTSKNKIIFHTQIDRYNRFKHLTYPVKTLIEELEKLKIDVILFTHTDHHCTQLWWDVLKANQKFRNIKVEYYGSKFHHLFHAYCSLTWNKNLQNILVVDGAGARFENNKEFYKWFERESYYTFDKKLKLITNEFNYIGKKYEHFTEKYFFNGLNCGKTMAWSLYDERPKKIQDDFETQMTSLINKLNIKNNLTFTGGCAQNILYNSKLLKKFNSLFCDPFNGDFGLSLGAANYFSNNKIFNQEVYLGIPQNINTDLFLKHKIINAESIDVAKILQEDPVAIFQSRSEQGQRGLGNRSLLMNPIHKDAQKKLNEIKKREWFRPFACSILNEESNNWFDMSIKESPHMMYVFDLKKIKKIY